MPSGSIFSGGGVGYIGRNNNQGTYGGNNAGGAYQNPGGGYKVPDYWSDTSSGEFDWKNRMRPDEANWSNGAPGHLGQTLSYNPQTGESSYVNSTQGVVLKDNNWGTGGTGTLTYKDPKTGLTVINQPMLQKFLGALGVGAGGSASAATSEMPDFNPYEIDTPADYEGYTFEQSPVDPSDVIAKSQYAIDENMDKDFALAGKQAGKSGWAMSTGYTNNLGDAARRASQDTGKLIAGYQYDAAKHASDQFQEQQLLKAAQDAAAWAKSGDWKMGSQMYTGDQTLQQFLANLDNNQFNAGQTNTVNMNNDALNAQSEQARLAMLSQILGGLF